MTKIIYVTNTSYTLVSLRMNLMKNMKRLGYDVSACAPRDKNSNIIEKNKIGFYDIPMSQTGMNFFEELKTIFSLIIVFYKLKPDIIHLFSIKAIIWGGLVSILFPRSSVVSTFTGMGVLRSCSEKLRRILFGIIKLSHNKRKKYVFQNHPDLNFFENYTNITNCSNLVSGSGVNTDYFKKNHTSNGKRTFLLFSRMLQSKGIIDYLTAVSNLEKNISEQANFILLGGAYPENPNNIDEEWLIGSDAIDPELLFLKSKAAKVDWIEHDNNVLKYLNKSDVVILPTYYPEGLPRSLLEAMSCENAIITTRMPGCEDVVDGSNGYLINPKDIRQLEKYIKKFILMTNSDLDNMKKRSRSLVIENFSDNIVINKYNNIYKDILK